MKHRHSTKQSRNTMDFIIYALGLLIVVAGTAICYVLALSNKITEADASLMLTIVAFAGSSLTTIGVVLRAHRAGKEAIGPLIFGSGLIMALTGSLAIHTLAMSQTISEITAMVGLAWVMVLSFILAIIGIIRRNLYVEKQAGKRVILGPLNEIYSRRVHHENHPDKQQDK